EPGRLPAGSCTREKDSAMKSFALPGPASVWRAARVRSLPLAAGLLAAAACAPSTTTTGAGEPEPSAGRAAQATPATTPRSADPRVGLKAGLFDAEEAVWNLRVVSKTPPPPEFVGVTNSDLAFT